MKPALLTPILATPTAPGYVRQRVYNIRDYGAVLDCRTVTDGAITAASTSLTSNTAAFAATDVGKTVAVVGAGVAGAVLWATIVSRQSTTQVTISVAASTTVSAASLSIGTDDTQAWLNAIAAAAVRGGRVTEDWGGTSLITAPLPFRRGVSVSGVYPGVLPANGSSWDLGFTIITGTIITFPGGVVFQQDTSGGNGTASAVDGVSLESLGFNQVGSLVVCGATNKTGLSGSELRGLWSSNVSGVAFDLKNLMHVHMANCKSSYVSQLIRLTSDYDTAVINHQPGNSRFDDLYGYVTAAGHALPTVHLQCLAPNGTGTALNYCHFTRLQVNRFASVSLTGNHLLLAGASIGAPINSCTFDGLDLEGYAQYRIQLLQAYKNRIVINGNCIAGNATADLQMRTSLYNLVHNGDVNLVLDMDDSASPTHWVGSLKSITGGNRLPLGIHWDSTKGGGAQLVLERLAAWNDSTFGVVAMPQVDQDYQVNGGGPRLRRTLWNSASVLTLNLTTLGYVELTFAGATSVTLPDATLCPRREVTFKQMATTGSICTISTTSSQTIDGALTNTWLDTQYKYLTLMSNGTNWLIIAKG